MWNTVFFLQIFASISATVKLILKSKSPRMINSIWWSGKWDFQRCLGHISLGKCGVCILWQSLFKHFFQNMGVIFTTKAETRTYAPCNWICVFFFKGFIRDTVIRFLLIFIHSIIELISRHPLRPQIRSQTWNLISFMLCTAGQRIQTTWFKCEVWMATKLHVIWEGDMRTPSSRARR